MNNYIRKIVSATMAVAMCVGMVACGGAPAGSSTSAVTPDAASSAAPTDGAALPAPVELTIATFRVGTHNAAAAEARYFKEFQEFYNGVDRQKITLKIEEMPSDQEYYNQMKVRAASNTLPDVFEGNGGVLELAVENGIAVNMAPYVDADPKYKADLGEGAITAGKQWADGGLYNISYGLQAIGYFYNKDMFTAAGIKPATTWDEWMSNLEKLKTSGACKAPISMMTGENCWTSNLILASIVGTDGEVGNKFMNTRYVETYQTPEFIKAVKMVQTMLQTYTLPDAIGSDYATSANHFLNGETAIIANGPWMAADFSNPDKAPAGFADKVGVALYPEGGSISQFERGYSIAKSTKEKEDAAMKFIQFKTDAYGQTIHLEDAGVLPLTSNVAMSDDFKAKSPLVVEFVSLLNNISYKYQTIDTISYPSIINVAFPTLYPQLADGTLTAEAFTVKLDESAAKDALNTK